jgi:hypothetical protein
MATLRHLGIRTEDTGKLASFYVDVFDMKVIHKSKEEGGTIFLSDGYFNVSKFSKLTYTGGRRTPNALARATFLFERSQFAVSIRGFSSAAIDESANGLSNGSTYSVTEGASLESCNTTVSRRRTQKLRRRITI